MLVSEVLHHEVDELIVEPLTRRQEVEVILAKSAGVVSEEDRFGVHLNIKCF